MMILEKNILMDTEDGIFINLSTGAKLVLKREGKKGQLISKEINEKDIERAFLENGIDIGPCKEKKPEETEINIFQLFIGEYIKGNKMFGGLKIIS